jgi:predicted house-cleaning noncanonical NTP pyrophosphatase (MazG superfamily)
VSRTKLVRDLVPKIMQSAGVEPAVQVLPRADLLRWLLWKLEEETRELCENPSTDEIVDVFEVLRAIAQYLGTEWQEIERVRVTKAAVRGGFDTGLALEIDEEPG